MSLINLLKVASLSSVLDVCNAALDSEAVY